MSTINDYLVHSLSTSQNLLQRYVADLTPQEYLHRPTSKANCAAWLLGHLILSERRALGVMGVTNLPTLPEGFEKRYARDPGAPTASDFGDVMVLLPLWNQHRSLLIETVGKAGGEQLDKPMEKPGPMFSTVGQFANFMAQHTTMHAGQITIIRRSLGKPPLV
jgi:hypothetical protein